MSLYLSECLFTIYDFSSGDMRTHVCIFVWVILQLGVVPGVQGSDFHLAEPPKIPGTIHFIPKHACGCRVAQWLNCNHLRTQL